MEAAMQLLEYAMAFVNAAANGDQGLVRGPAPLHRRFRYPESVEDPKSWPASTIAASDTITKTNAKDIFLLIPADMRDLWYHRYQPVGKSYQAMIYRERECEYRAWQVYGGPTGLAVARRNKAANARGPRMPAAAVPPLALPPIVPPQAFVMARGGGIGRGVTGGRRLPMVQATIGDRVVTPTTPIRPPPMAIAQHKNTAGASTSRINRDSLPAKKRPTMLYPASRLPTTPRCLGSRRITKSAVESSSTPGRDGFQTPQQGPSGRMSISLLEALDRVSLETPPSKTPTRVSLKPSPSSSQTSTGKRKRALANTLALGRGASGDSNEVIDITDSTSEEDGMGYGWVPKYGAKKSPKKKSKGLMGAKTEPEDVIVLSDSDSD